MKRILLTALIAMTVSSSAFAAITTVIGSTDCGKWIKEPSDPRKAWVLGFLSGLNADGMYKNVLRKISSSQQIFVWMDNYCKANPLKDTIDGSLQLILELSNEK